MIQLLCPSRHCIVATAYQSDDGEPIPEILERAKAMFEDFLKQGANRACGLCRSPRLHWEDGETGFATMEEAAPRIAEMVVRQAITREYFKASRG